MINIAELTPLIQTALAEDIGRGDITANILVAETAQAELFMTARESLIFCGGEIAAEVFREVTSQLECEILVEDGEEATANQKLLRVYGNARAILAAERVALNFVQHLSGVATLTNSYAKKLLGTKAKLLDTRKTLPLYRELEKYAVRVGGGNNHRMRLDDGILIKDNHIAICGSIENAVIAAKKYAPALMKVEVECDNLEQVQQAIEAGADVIMLDNMDVADIKTAVNMISDSEKQQGATNKHRKPELEVSGNISLENIREIAETGVDYISVGRITHSAPAVDIGLDIKLNHHQ